MLYQEDLEVLVYSKLDIEDLYFLKLTNTSNKRLINESFWINKFIKDIGAPLTEDRSVLTEIYYLSYSRLTQLSRLSRSLKVNNVKLYIHIMNNNFRSGNITHYLSYSLDVNKALTYRFLESWQGQEVLKSIKIKNVLTDFTIEQISSLNREQPLQGGQLKELFINSMYKNDLERFIIIKDMLIERGLYNADYLTTDIGYISNLKIVEELLELYPLEKCEILLQEAIIVGSYDIVKLIVDRGYTFTDAFLISYLRTSNINSYHCLEYITTKNIGEDLMNSIIISVGPYDSVEFIKSLISKGANVFAENGKSLISACKHDNVEVASFLLSIGLLNDESVQVAMISKNRNLVRLFLDINIIFGVHMVFPMILRNRKMEEEIISKLKIPFSIKPIKSITVGLKHSTFYLDMTFINPYLLEYILEFPVEYITTDLGVIIRTDNGDHITISYAQPSIETKFINACNVSNYSLVKDLIKKGADVNTNDGNPLTIAVSKNDITLVELLLANGVSIHSKAVTIAGENASLEILRLLIYPKI